MYPVKRFFKRYTIALLLANTLVLLYILYFFFIGSKHNGSSTHSNGFALMGLVIYSFPSVDILFIIVGIIASIMLKIKNKETNIVKNLLAAIFIPVAAWILFMLIVLEIWALVSKS
jgi:hypothetical protein